MNSTALCQPIAFPDRTHYGKNLPKNKIFEFATPSRKVRSLFVKEVEQIIWKYNLTTESTNLQATASVKEIQILALELRTKELTVEILRTIDLAIPSPIIFELLYGTNIKYAACYKRPSEADKKKWVISNYFFSDWMKKDSPAVDLPVALNLGGLYQSLLTSLCPLPLKQGESIDSLVSRADKLHAYQREAEKIERRISKEVQFNRKVELNSALNVIKTKIEELLTEH